MVRDHAMSGACSYQLNEKGKLASYIPGMINAAI